MSTDVTIYYVSLYHSTSCQVPFLEVKNNKSPAILKKKIHVTETYFALHRQRREAKVVDVELVKVFGHAAGGGEDHSGIVEYQGRHSRLANHRVPGIGM